MFLTTNRISAIDMAFKGRINLILPYYDLEEDSRKSVWMNFISRLGPGGTEIVHDDYDILAKVEMNGREFKNSIKTAMIQAERKKEPVKLEYIRVVLEIKNRAVTFDRLEEERKAARRQRLYLNSTDSE